MLLGWLGGEVVRVALEVSSRWEVSLRGSCWALGLQACCGVFPWVAARACFVLAGLAECTWRLGWADQVWMWDLVPS